MRNVIIEALKEYQIPGTSYQNITSKTAKVQCVNGNCFFLKETNINTDEKYKFLSYQHLDNILFPLKNERGNYITNISEKNYYLSPYYEENKLIDELKINHLQSELTNLHLNTYYRKELSPLTTKKKLEEIYDYLQYKFNTIEVFVRTVEQGVYDEYSILILKNYHFILEAKKVMGSLNKKIIDHIKTKKSVNYSFIHNNPKLNHLIVTDNRDYLISLERSKIGIPSMDIVKFYIETEDIQINRKEIIEDYFKRYDDEFYFDYFCFFVMLYYVKGIVIYEKDYVSSQSFVYSSQALKGFIETFNLK